jgi:peptidoglycan/LPS O-acetylase OafA/YrhL
VIFFVLLFRVTLHSNELDKWPALFLLGVASHGKDVLGGVSWSLDIELQFYLFLPVIVVVLEAVRGSGKWGLLLLGSAGLTVLGWYASLAFGIAPLLAYLPPFVIGSLIYLLDIRPSRQAAALSICVFVGFGLAVAILPQTRGLIDTTFEEPFNDEWFGMIWASLLVPFVAFNVRRKSNSLDRHMGDLSYSVYLLHNPLYVVITAVVGASFTLKLILLAMTIPVSLIPYLLIDQPLARRRGVFIRFLITRWYAKRLMRDR